MINDHTDVTVPYRFNNVNYVSDYRLKMSLKNIINKTIILINQTSQYEYDLKTKSIVTNFLNNFEKRCQNITSLNIWGKWLEKYGLVTITRLSSIVEKNQTKVLSYDNEKHTDLMFLISTLINTLTEFHIVNPKVFKTPLLSILDDLVDTTHLMSPNNDSVYYKNIIEDISDITYSVLNLSSFKLFVYDEELETSIILKLMKLENKLKKFVDIDL